MKVTAAIDRTACQSIAIRRRVRLSYAAGDIGFIPVWRAVKLSLLFCDGQFLHLPLGCALPLHGLPAPVIAGQSPSTRLAMMFR